MRKILIQLLCVSAYFWIILHFILRYDFVCIKTECMHKAENSSLTLLTFQQKVHILNNLLKSREIRVLAEFWQACACIVFAVTPMILSNWENEFSRCILWFILVRSHKALTSSFQFCLIIWIEWQREVYGVKDFFFTFFGDLMKVMVFMLSFSDKILSFASTQQPSYQNFMK